MNGADQSAIVARMLGCGPQSAHALSSAMEFKTFAARTYLAHQGDVGDAFWLIIDGVIQLRANSADGQATVISACSAGEMIGAYDLERDAAYDTYAFTQVRALCVNADRLGQIVDDFPDVARGLARIFSGQLFLVLERLANRVTLSASGRFYQELLKEAGDADEIAPPPVVSVLALSAQTTRETGSRALSTLERRGLITRDPEKLTIVSRRMVEELIV